MRNIVGNWCEGEDHFNRELELQALQERVRDGNHTLLTAQRRMGKTSLVRELLRRLKETREFETIFVDLEAAADPADAIAEIGVQSSTLRGVWDRIKDGFSNLLQTASGRIEELSVADLRVKLRAGIDAGNWQHRGDTLFAALGENSRPVVLAIDELPILVNKMLKDDAGVVTPEGTRATEEFLSWLRKNGQAHGRRVCVILSGSVGLEPLLEAAGLSPLANIYFPYDLKPWSEETAADCLAALAESYGMRFPLKVREDMCRRLRCCIPHHVQVYFDKMRDHLRHAGREDATPTDSEFVYEREMLSVRGQVHLQHYEGRLETILGWVGYPIALEILSATAVEGRLDGDAVEQYRCHYLARNAIADNAAPTVDQVLRMLEHDGYLERKDDGYCFVSGLLEDWWRNRHGASFRAAVEPRRRGQGDPR
ncbi:MAG: AAA family ATPase [bacterium]|nr:AAA family ATPase [bacterium]